MSRALLLNFSPHGKAARVYRLAADVLGDWPGISTLMDRQLGADPLPALTSDYATAVTSVAGMDNVAIHASERQIVELETSDLLVLCTPLHNFTLPAAMKLWIDHVVRIQRSFGVNGAGEKFGLLKDRPTFVLVSSGGLIQGEQARQPDFLTPYLKAILNSIGIHQLTFIYLEGTVRGGEAVEQAVLAAREALLRGLQANTRTCWSPLAGDEASESCIT
ncbi:MULTISPECIES: NAD(P)H-dependent oxidoreductase [unclassified Pseudomonas]|uniref:FMN-dependent NADH-azoreductase n=1 Tax=unclassified Pseudomonas TaxID=196821 RepID=UPI00128C4DCB|nr:MULTISPECIES: NAD(P)H-dependent oxidoreductase [unclassified Pseudomonas]MPQ67099.1 FMN-dependent NADH-azoreductase [Pseudomonas sp. MWU12-2323]